MIMKILLEMAINDVPESSVIGERERKELIHQFQHLHNKDNVRKNIEEAHSQLKGLFTLKAPAIQYNETKAKVNYASRNVENVSKISEKYQEKREALKKKA